MTDFPIVLANLQKNSRERVRVALDQYQGRDLLDIRVTTQMSDAADVWSPTKKGVALSVTLLPELRAAVVKSEQQAIALGLIGGGA